MRRTTNPCLRALKIHPLCEHDDSSTPNTRANVLSSHPCRELFTLRVAPLCTIAHDRTLSIVPSIRSVHVSPLFVRRIGETVADVSRIKSACQLIEVVQLTRGTSTATFHANTMNLVEKSTNMSVTAGGKLNKKLMLLPAMFRSCHIAQLVWHDQTIRECSVFHPPLTAQLVVMMQEFDLF